MIQLMAKGIAHEMIKDSSKTLERCLEEYLYQKNIQINPEDFREIMYDIACVDKYVCSYFRENVIRTLIDNNIKVHIYPCVVG